MSRGVNRLNLKLKHLKVWLVTDDPDYPGLGQDTPDSPDYPDENPDSPGQVQRSQKLDKCEWKLDRVILELPESACKTIQPDKLDRNLEFK